MQSFAEAPFPVGLQSLPPFGEIPYHPVVVNVVAAVDHCAHHVNDPRRLLLAAAAAVQSHSPHRYGREAYAVLAPWSDGTDGAYCDLELLVQPSGLSQPGSQAKSPLPWFLNFSAFPLGFM